MAQRATDEYVFYSVDRQHGLSHSAVICVFKDNEGLMWFGTYDGLNCFDSRDMEVYRSGFSISPTLDNNAIYSICQADGNNLWISSRFAVNRFSKETKSVVAYHRLPPASHLVSNSRGDSWIVSADSISYYNTFHERFMKIEFSGVLTSDTQSFMAHNGVLWLFPASGQAGGGGGAYKVSLDGYNIPENNTQPTILLTEFHHCTVEVIFPQNDSSFCFVDSDKNLYLYDVALQSKIRIRNIGGLLQKYGRITGITFINNDVIAAFQTNGLIKFAADNYYREEIIDQNLRIFALYRDSEQDITWIASDGRGATMYTKSNSIATNLISKSLSPNLTRQVRSIMTDSKGGLWLGTKGDGLIHIRNYNEGMTIGKTVVHFPGKLLHAHTYTRENIEFSIFTLSPGSRDDGFWIGAGETGLCRFDFEQGKIESTVDNSGMGQPKEIHGVYEASTDVLYVATAAGTGFRRLKLDRSGEPITIEEQKQYDFFYDDVRINTFFAMLAEGDSVLWLGSKEKGLVRFDLRTETYKVLSISKILNRPVDDVLSIHKATNGDMFVGTTTGLVRLKFLKDIGSVHDIYDGIDARYFGCEQGLANDMIHGILEDENGFLWLSTNYGLAKFSIDNLTLRNYNYSDGLQISEFSDDASWKCPLTGRLFFGGVNGLSFIDSNASTSVKHKVDIVLRKLTIDGHEVNLSDHMVDNNLDLGYVNAGFALSFVVPYFVSNATIEYSWMLEGHDKTWSPFGIARKAAYENVAPGQYTFHVRFRRDAFDSEIESFSIPLRIMPRWWQTAFFHMVVTIAVIFLLSALSYAILLYVRNKRLVRKIISQPGSIPDTALSPANVTKKDTDEKSKPSSDFIGQFARSSPEQADFIHRTVILIEKNIAEETLGATLLADKMNMSTRQFYRKFGEISHVHLKELILDIRMKKAAVLLLEGRLSISEVIDNVGIASRSYFHQEFRKKFGMTPKNYRTLGNNENLLKIKQS